MTLTRYRWYGWTIYHYRCPKVMLDLDILSGSQRLMCFRVPEELRLFALRSHVSRSTPPQFIVEKGGEMPEGVVSESLRQESAPVPQQQTLGLFDRISTPPPTLPSFQQYEVPGEDTRASTPEPIKVTRAKKKGPSSTKKKRTVNPEN